MFDDFKIGKGNHGNSWYRILGQPDNYRYAENSVSYSVHGAILNTEFIVMKDTEVGKKLTDMFRSMNSKSLDLKVIHTYVDDLVLTTLTPAQLRIKIAEQIEDSFHTGVKHAQIEMRKSLGL